jgi:hypothetical protein
MYRKNVTMIDELPDLESGSRMHGPSPDMQMQSMQGMPPRHMMPDQRPEDMTFVNKFLRDNSNKSGMGKYDEVANPQMYGPPQPQSQQHSPPIMNAPNEMDLRTLTSVNCVDVMHHIKDCPVCLKLYNANDKSLYIVIIIILGLVCLLLIKRIFEK